MTNREQTILKAVDQALAAAWRQHDAAMRLALRYPEAAHVLSDPRKPEVIAVLERLRHWMTALEPAARQEDA